MLLFRSKFFIFLLFLLLPDRFMKLEIEGISIDPEFLDYLKQIDSLIHNC